MNSTMKLIRKCFDNMVMNASMFAAEFFWFCESTILQNNEIV